MKLLPVAGVICVIVAMVLLIFGVVCFSDAERLDRERYLEPLHYECPLFEVDLNSPGRYEGVLGHRYTHPHGYWLVVETEKPYGSCDDAELAIEGLQVLLCFPDVEDESLSTGQRLERSSAYCGPDGEYWPAFDITGTYWPDELGDYRIALDVKAPAKATFDRPQRIVWRYRLCPCIRMVAIVSRLIGGVAVFFAVVLLVLAWYLARRNEARRRLQSPPDSQNVADTTQTGD